MPERARRHRRTGEEQNRDGLDTHAWRDPITLVMLRGWRCIADPRGATTAEYAMLLALVVVVLLGVLTELGQELRTQLSAIVAELQGVQ